MADGSPRPNITGIQDAVYVPLIMRWCLLSVFLCTIFCPSSFANYKTSFMSKWVGQRIAPTPEVALTTNSHKNESDETKCRARFSSNFLYGRTVDTNDG